MGWRTVLVENASKVSYKNKYIVINNDEQNKIFIDEIDVIIFANTQVNITGVALCELSKNKVKIIFCDEKYNPYAELVNLYGSHNCSKKVELQTKWQVENKVTLFTSIIDAKIANQATMLRKLGFEESAMQLDGYRSELEYNDATNREGHSAKVYFNTLFGKSFSRNLQSDINAALDYGYSILLSYCNREVVKNGCLTQLGLKHCNEFNYFNLSCDLMEPFRPLVDECVYQNRDEKFDTEYKRKLIDLLNKRVVFDKLVYLGNAMSTMVKSCIDAMNCQDMGKLKLFYLV